jgi:hypothetical protein
MSHRHGFSSYNIINSSQNCLLSSNDIFYNSASEMSGRVARLVATCTHTSRQARTSPGRVVRPLVRRADSRPRLIRLYHTRTDRLADGCERTDLADWSACEWGPLKVKVNLSPVLIKKNVLHPAKNCTMVHLACSWSQC